MEPTSISVDDSLKTLEDGQTLQDSLSLIELMQKITTHEPKIWNRGTIGFDSYHYKYESGREGDCHILGFYPRKDKITFYLMDGTERYADQLEKLGKYSMSKACLYIKRLSDVDIKILEEILQESYRYMKVLEKEMNEK